MTRSPAGSNPRAIARRCIECVRAGRWLCRRRDCLPAIPSSPLRATDPSGGPMNYETLLYEHTGHVVTLTYNRPHQHNAVNRTMNAELHHAWERFRDDEEAFVLVIT